MVTTLKWFVLVRHEGKLYFKLMERDSVWKREELS